MSEPFLKWPGGKRWLAYRFEDLFPESVERYIEPFLGSGAVFFRLKPRKAILADTNEELVNAYKILRSSADEIERRLRILQRKHCADLYYKIRAERPDDDLEQAVRFIYLNRTCFNGIYRVNRAGEFNVPLGSKTQVEYPEGFLQDVATTLRTASIRVADFEVTINSAKKGDFVFVDPPYTVMHNNNNFVKYNSHLFSWEDQERLAKAVRRADARGALVMLSNANHKSVRQLYDGFGLHRQVARRTVLAAGSEHRCATSELLITSFEQHS
jgi:DNA adenine methylase